jgi:hypothetical protein
MIHETAGSLSFAASNSNWPCGRCVSPLMRSGESNLACRNALKFSSMLQP